jgi:flagellar protein FlbT
MPLKLSLRPGERFVVNGAVMQNGERRAVLMLQNQASVLREKDILQPDEANTPARRIYFPIMLLYLGEGDAAALHDQARLRLGEFFEAVVNPEVRADCAELGGELEQGQFYKALSRCRRLIAYEDAILDPAQVRANRSRV